MTRVFLDANILFSASWRPESKINQLWLVPDIVLVTSNYAINEAERNLILKKPAGLTHFKSLLDKTELSYANSPAQPSHGLPVKDIPILESALGSNCTVLLTGDTTHFGHLIGQEIQGVSVFTVMMFLENVARAETSD